MTAARSLSAPPAAAAIATAALVMLLGGLMTERSTWHDALQRPEWQPPTWLFGPVWAAIFVLTVSAFLLAWRNADGAGRTALLAAYGTNAVLNVLWSFLFFQAHRPDLALADIVLLLVSILGLIVYSSRHAPLAGALLVPYLAWVSFAAILNFQIVRLNGPFS